MRTRFDSTQQASLPFAPRRFYPYAAAPGDYDDEYFTAAIRAYFPSMHHSRDIIRTGVVSRENCKNIANAHKPFSTKRESLQINVQKTILSSSLILSLTLSASPFSTCLLIKNVNDL
jgi:hypothetical protein